MPDMNAKAVSQATMRPVIVRACVRCGGKRELDKPCSTCGNTVPPVTHDLGIQAAYYKNPVKRAWWSLIGQHLAARRARAANREASNSGHNR